VLRHLGRFLKKKQSHIFFRNLGPTPRSVPNWNYGKVHAHRSAHARARQRDHAHDTAGASGTFCAHRQFCSIYFNKIFFQKIVTWVCLCTTTHPWPSVYPTVAPPPLPTLPWPSVYPTVARARARPPARTHARTRPAEWGGARACVKPLQSSSG
jgi:hypothetical protein